MGDPWRKRCLAKLLAGRAINKRLQTANEAKCPQQTNVSVTAVLLIIPFSVCPLIYDQSYRFTHDTNRLQHLSLVANYLASLGSAAQEVTNENKLFTCKWGCWGWWGVRLDSKIPLVQLGSLKGDEWIVIHYLTPGEIYFSPILEIRDLLCVLVKIIYNHWFHTSFIFQH